MQISRHVCTCKCYDTCSMFAYVDNGRLLKVSGNPLNSYTLGTLCPKGYSLVQQVYHPDRVLYPLRQSMRGSGDWKRITWEEALQEISGNILRIYHKNGDLLPLALLDGKANTGALARSLSGMLSSIASITQIESPQSGGPGLDAQLLDFGGYSPKDPEDMRKAELIVLWGVNPASTAIHQMGILQQARRRGTKVILIDVFPSTTADRVDEIILVKPGGDGALALAVLRQLIFKSSVNYRFLLNQAEGWESLKDWLLETDPAEMSEAAGVSSKIIAHLADEIRRSSKPVFWIGKGLQKYANSGQSIRAIHALAAAGGLMETCGEGIYTSQPAGSLLTGLWDSDCAKNRKISFSSIQNSQANNPRLSMLWITQSNPLVQGSELQAVQEMMDSLDLIVTTGHFLTPTSLSSDIALPATTFLEAEDLVAGSWHQWLGFNEQAIRPQGEARSELAIAQSLAMALNEKSPGICPFPVERTIAQWLQRAVSQEVYDMLGIDNFQELRNGPRKVLVKNLSAKTKDQKYKFIAPEALELGCPEIPSMVAPLSHPKGYPYRLIGLRRADRLNSQLGNIRWLLEGQAADEILISGELARLKGIGSEDKVTVYNQRGEIVLKAKVCQELPGQIVVCSARQDINGKSINTLVGGREADMGKASNGVNDLAFNEVFVNIVRY